MQIIKRSILTQNSKNPSIVAVLFLTSLEYIQPLHHLESFINTMVVENEIFIGILHLAHLFTHQW